MSEVFMAANPMGDVASFTTVETSSLEWSYGGSEGFWLKRLYEDANSGDTTYLMKVDAGAHADSHAHDQIEQIYVIEGTFYDQTRTYQAGGFIIRPPGTNHTAGSEAGAVVMVIYTS